MRDVAAAIIRAWFWSSLYLTKTLLINTRPSPVAVALVPDSHAWTHKVVAVEVAVGVEPRSRSHVQCREDGYLSPNIEPGLTQHQS